MFNQPAPEKLTELDEAAWLEAAWLEVAWLKLSACVRKVILCNCQSQPVAIVPGLLCIRPVDGKKREGPCYRRFILVTRLSCVRFLYNSSSMMRSHRTQIQNSLCDNMRTASIQCLARKTHELLTLAESAYHHAWVTKIELHKNNIKNSWVRKFSQR